MKNKKVISRLNMPSHPPIVSTLVALLALDYWNAPQWLWGAVIFLYVIIWISFFINVSKEDIVDIFEVSDKIETTKSKWQQRYDAMMRDKS